MVHPVTTEAQQTVDNTSSSGAANAATVDLGRVSRTVNLAVNVSAPAFAVIEVSKNGTFGGEEHELTNKTYASATEDVIQDDQVAYQHARAYANASVNTLELVGRGI